MQIKKHQNEWRKQQLGLTFPMGAAYFGSIWRQNRLIVNNSNNDITISNNQNILRNHCIHAGLFL